MKVHVLCPAASVTGGPEALHQLVDAGQCLGFDMAMVYLPEDDPDPTPDVFRMYQPRVVRDIVDAPGNVVIVPETGSLQLLALRHATRVLWWLSVEHFQLRAESMRQAGTAGGAGGASALDFVFDARHAVTHLAQSEYARQWVERQGSTALMLTDYVRDEIVQRAARHRQATPKHNIVAYNPKKGLEFTQRLMAASPPDIQWVPIQNMSPAEVADLLGRAKVYVDFGPHPGRDRIPREAALCGCVVITNTQGSAGNAVDVPLPSRYKFDERHPLAMTHILARIAEACTDHARLAADLAPYRQWIEDQRRVFLDETFWVLATLEAEMKRAAQLRLAA